MLLCFDCHKEIDITRKADFPKERLQMIKNDFERFIFKNTDLTINKKTYCITYFPNLRNKTIITATPTLIEGKYILNKVDLAMSNYDSSIIDWEVEKKNLVINFNKKVKPLMDEKHNLSIFALGPIPLLMYFGYLLSNIHEIDIYQTFSRE